MMDKMAGRFRAARLKFDHFCTYGMAECSQCIWMGLPTGALENFRQASNKLASGVLVVVVCSSPVLTPRIVDRLISGLDENVVR